MENNYKIKITGSGTPEQLATKLRSLALEMISTDTEGKFDEEFDGRSFEDEILYTEVQKLDGVYYQPEIDENGAVKGHVGQIISSFIVWRDKDNLMKDFPNCTPIEYSGDDIEDVTYWDDINKTY